VQVFWADVDHQVCAFHILQEITKAVLKAVARSRKDLKAQKTKRKRGRPSGTKARAVARKNKRLQQKIKDLFDHRHLFVKRTLTDKEKRMLQRMTGGFPSLRALRSIMDQVYHSLIGGAAQIQRWRNWDVYGLVSAASNPSARP
jgi:hypothetical protein